MTSDGPFRAAKSPPLRRYSRSRLAGRLVDRIIPQPQAGVLQIVLPTGAQVERAASGGGSGARIVFRRWRGLARIVLGGGNGFARGYIEGDWSTPDLGTLLAFFMRNETAFKPRSSGSWWSCAWERLRHRLRDNSRRGSRRNVAAHYDLGNAFYRKWLDAGMNYSSAIRDGSQTLEQAQDAKLDRIASLLELSAGQHVLEIGCGWGALAEIILRRHSCSVTGITLSREQLDYVARRLGAEVADGRASFRLLDYRDLKGRFDRVVSIEMLEAVGERYWRSYFQTLSRSLVDGGIAVLQVITIDESRFEGYRRRPDFIQRSIFPGGMLPTASAIRDGAAKAGLSIAQHEAFGESYAWTLAEWRTRFLSAWTSIEAMGFDRRFQRLWVYYLTYCEIGFRFQAVNVRLFKLIKQAGAAPAAAGDGT